MYGLWRRDGGGGEVWYLQGRARAASDCDPPVRDSAVYTVSDDCVSAPPPPSYHRHHLAPSPPLPSPRARQRSGGRRASRIPRQRSRSSRSHAEKTAAGGRKCGGHVPPLVSYSRQTGELLPASGRAGKGRRPAVQNRSCSGPDRAGSGFQLEKVKGTIFVIAKLFFFHSPGEGKLFLLSGNALPPRSPNCFQTDFFVCLSSVNCTRNTNAALTTHDVVVMRLARLANCSGSAAAQQRLWSAVGRRLLPTIDLTVCRASHKVTPETAAVTSRARRRPPPAGRFGRLLTLRPL